MTRLRVLLALSTAVLFTACGPPAAEDKLQNAAENVKEAKRDVNAASQNVTNASDDLASHRKAVNDAERALASAKKKLRRVQRRLAKSKARLDSTATDTGIFRLVQASLLDDPALQNTAVYASVIDGSVSLHGEVSTMQQKARAGEIARNAPGVSNVRNLVDVENADSDDE